MKRHSFDLLVSAVGLLIAAILLVAGGLLTWSNSFIHDEVKKELTSQQVFFPEKGSASIAEPQYDPIRQYAGQQLTTGAQAEAYANHYINNHLQKIGGGKTYAQLSSQLQADPTNTKLSATVDSMFKGETLRGLLLNAYAFDTIATIAGIAAIAAFGAAGLMIVLAALGFWHARRVPPTTEFLVGHSTPTPEPALT